VQRCKNYIRSILNVQDYQDNEEKINKYIEDNAAIFETLTLGGKSKISKSNRNRKRKRKQSIKHKYFRRNA
jgi:hypothetical protein